MHDFAFDEIHDEIVVTGPLTQSILTFRGAASGEEAPLRVIQGDKTRIKGVGALDKVSIDPVHNEIYVSTPDQLILVFDRLANGNVAPKRVLGGPDTQLSLGHQNTNESVGNTGPEWNVYGGGNGPRLRIDPIHNLLFVPQVGGGEGGGGKILVFDRTASGNTPPKFTVKATGGGYDIYFPKLRMITHPRNDFEVFQLSETGESKLIAEFPAPLGRGGAATMDLDPVHKEVLVATSSGNTVLTFSVPELYDERPDPPLSSEAPTH